MMMGILIAIEEMDSGEKVVVEYDNVTVGDEIDPSGGFRSRYQSIHRSDINQTSARCLRIYSI